MHRISANLSKELESRESLIHEREPERDLDSTEREKERERERKKETNATGNGNAPHLEAAAVKVCGAAEFS